MKIAEREMTNPKVREKADVSASTFTKMKKNEYVSIESLEKIANVLDCEIGDLIEIVNKEDSKQKSNSDGDRK